MAADIKKRTYHFALRIIKLSAALLRTGTMQVLGRQLLRSGTSIGANVQEAQNALTKKEFVYFMNVARREAGETGHWLRLLSEAQLIRASRLTDITEECDQITRVLGSIVRKSTRSRKSLPT